MLEEQQNMQKAKLEALRRAVAEGLKELAQGEGVPGDQMFETILAGLDGDRAPRA